MLGWKTKQILIALAVVMLVAMAAYVKLWTIAYQISATEAAALRQQFDLASREAMDESAAWRQRFDTEAGKNQRCMKELNQMKKSRNFTDVVGLNKKLVMLEKNFQLPLLIIFVLNYKENMDLLERIEMLKQELEAEKLNCNARQ
ncbi:OLC1v1034571C1 [Oldenlandia corymbosa var. corymbosa]|uniref:OLC1v1034571C1 n=1 Tax=Oldenlandia corymbosa var. corymbosa TaxID=529605 RepID=A0AAV1CU24_OLDCO|nr:OLC1v1034571C1 [Oldenlandia corymbosa var. corymbosa]